MITQLVISTSQIFLDWSRRLLSSGYEPSAKRELSNLLSYLSRFSTLESSIKAQPTNPQPNQRKEKPMQTQLVIDNCHEAVSAANKLIADGFEAEAAGELAKLREYLNSKDELSAGGDPPEAEGAESAKADPYEHMPNESSTDSDTV